MIWIILGIILLIVSINDFLFFRIEDGVILSIFVLYIFAIFAGASGGNFLYSFMIASITFIITFLLNQFNLMGGGDVKLFFPILLLSEGNFFLFFMTVALSGFIISLIYICFGKCIYLLRKKIIHSLCNIKNKTLLLKIALPSFAKVGEKNISLMKFVPKRFDQEIPYGIAISCGGFFVILENLLSR